jgi:uncharacterized membrane protein
MSKKMKSHAIRHWLSVVRTNYWFIPAVTIAACLGLAYLMLQLDAALPERFILKLGWVYTRDPAGARAILSVISESMMTVAGVVFSVMLVALTLASNQFGTRVLKASPAMPATRRSSASSSAHSFIVCWSCAACRAGHIHSCRAWP